MLLACLNWIVLHYFIYLWTMSMESWICFAVLQMLYYFSTPSHIHTHAHTHARTHTHTHTHAHTHTLSCSGVYHSILPWALSWLDGWCVMLLSSIIMATSLSSQRNTTLRELQLKCGMGGKREKRMKVLYSFSWHFYCTKWQVLTLFFRRANFQTSDNHCLFLHCDKLHIPAHTCIHHPIPPLPLPPLPKLIPHLHFTLSSTLGTRRAWLIQGCPESMPW